MAKNSPESADLEIPHDSRTLTTEDVRESVRFHIRERLDKNVFETLQRTGTESLTVYLCAISIEPIVRSWTAAQRGLQDLLKGIWPTQHAMVEQYLADNKLTLDHLAHSVQTLLDTDEFGARVFETLAIFTEVIPLMEEQFHLKEWVLLQLRMELQTWYLRGRFQRLSVTIPSEQFSPSSMSRGDLQIQVSASKPTIVAGQEFSVFVVVSNPV